MLLMQKSDYYINRKGKIMRRIIQWIEDEYKEAGIKGLQSKIVLAVINDTLLKVENSNSYGFDMKISKNITICYLSDGNVTVSINRKELAKSKAFKSVISLKPTKYYWVRYKLHEPEIMQVLTKANYIDLYFAEIGTKNKYEFSEITVLEIVLNDSSKGAI